MRISRIESFGGSCPPEKPLTRIWGPPGPVEGTASPRNAAERPPGPFGRASRSFPRSTRMFMLLPRDDSAEIITSCLPMVTSSLMLISFFSLSNSTRGSSIVGASRFFAIKACLTRLTSSPRTSRVNGVPVCSFSVGLMLLGSRPVISKVPTRACSPGVIV